VDLRWILSADKELYTLNILESLFLAGITASLARISLLIHIQLLPTLSLTI
jgi:hypothetical protein